MSLFHIFILAIVQGITEFLPISSSAHLILLHNIFDNGKLLDIQSDRILDIAVHIGTLMAVLVFYHREVISMFRGTVDIVKSRSLTATANSRLITLVVFSSIPCLIAGFAVYKLVDPAFFYNPHIIAWTTISFGVLLGIADFLGRNVKSVETLTFKHGFIIGLAQCISLLPGVSRSGITMTAGRFLGMSRVEAARFSLLLAIVITTAVGFAGVLDLRKMGDIHVTYDALIAVGIAFVTALGMIWIMIKGLMNFSFLPYVIYRIILGGALIWFLYLK